MRLTPSESALRLETARFGVLATADHKYGAHVVPVVFAVDGSDLAIPVDSVKTKSTTQLRRISNLERDPRATLLVDHRNDDWSELWWVRANLTFIGHDDTTETDRMVFGAKYDAYKPIDSIESVVRFTVDSLVGWSAEADGET